LQVSPEGQVINAVENEKPFGDVVAEISFDRISRLSWVNSLHSQSTGDAEKSLFNTLETVARDPEN
jgi:hypothetical protein